MQELEAREAELVTARAGAAALGAALEAREAELATARAGAAAAESAAASVTALGAELEAKTHELAERAAEAAAAQAAEAAAATALVRCGPARAARPCERAVGLTCAQAAAVMAALARNHSLTSLKVSKRGPPTGGARCRPLPEAEARAAGRCQARAGRGRCHRRRAGGAAGGRVRRGGQERGRCSSGQGAPLQAWALQRRCTDVCRAWLRMAMHMLRGWTACWACGLVRHQLEHRGYPTQP